MKYKNQFIKLVDCNDKECNVIQVSITKAKNAYNNGMTIWLQIIKIKLWVTVYQSINS